MPAATQPVMTVGRRSQARVAPALPRSEALRSPPVLIPARRPCSRPKASWLVLAHATGGVECFSREMLSRMGTCSVGA